MRQWMDIGIRIPVTQHAWIHTVRTTPQAAVLRRLVCSVLGFGAASQFAFFPQKLFFPGRMGSRQLPSGTLRVS